MRRTGLGWGAWSPFLPLGALGQLLLKSWEGLLPGESSSWGLGTLPSHDLGEGWVVTVSSGPAWKSACAGAMRAPGLALSTGTRVLGQFQGPASGQCGSWTSRAQRLLGGWRGAPNPAKTSSEPLVARGAGGGGAVPPDSPAPGLQGERSEREIASCQGRIRGPGGRRVGGLAPGRLALLLLAPLGSPLRQEGEGEAEGKPARGGQGSRVP